MKMWKGHPNRVTEMLSGSTPAIGCCLILYALLLAACSAPGSPLASEAPSQTVEASSSSLKITPYVSNTTPAIEMPGDEHLAVLSDLPDLGLAPELSSQVWLNTDQPLRLGDLGGKVILLDMWTFG